MVVRLDDKGSFKVKVGSISCGSLWLCVLQPSAIFDLSLSVKNLLIDIDLGCISFQPRDNLNMSNEMVSNSTCMSNALLFDRSEQ